MMNTGINNVVMPFIIIAITCLSSAFALAEMPEGLVAYYAFEGNAEDSSGNGHHGTVHEATYVDGKFGMGLAFTGADTSYVEVLHSDLLTPSDAVTISLWFKVYSYINSYACLVYKAGEQPTANGFRDRCYSLWSRSSQSIHLTSTPEGASSQIQCNGGSYELDYFVHLAAVIDSVSHTMTIYIDGVKVQECPYSGDAIRGGAYPLRIGGPFKTLGDQSGLNGVIDEVAIFNRVLSEYEIDQLYMMFACAPDYNHDGVINGKDVSDKRKDMELEFQTWLKECWKPASEQ